jgi:hypothetical protein
LTARGTVGDGPAPGPLPPHRHLRRQPVLQGWWDNPETVISVTVPADVVGGADDVYICLDTPPAHLNCLTFDRPKTRA